MYENVNEAIEELLKILDYIESVNHDDTYHLALELGHQFQEELQTSNADLI